MIERTAVYRFYDRHGQLLYVGMTSDTDERFKVHARKATWWPEAARHEIEWHSTRDDAATAEKAAVKTERPRWNSHSGGGGRPATGKTPIRSLGRIGHLWDEAAELAATRGETMSAVARPILERGLRDYVDQHRADRP